MTPGGKPPYYRRRWIVRPAYQWKVTLGIAAFFTMFAVILVALVYVALLTTLSSLELAEEAIFIEVFNVVVWTVVVQLLLVLPVLIIFGIGLTHRIVGPLDRIMAALNQLTEGNFDVRLQIRKHDLLRDVEDAISRVAASLRQRYPK